VSDQDHPSADLVKPHDRRAFLTRAGAGAAVGGLVWVAPSILTLDAAAAASCVGNTGLVWNNFATGAGAGVFATGAGANLVNVTVTTTNPNGVGSSGGGGSLGNNFSVIANQIGGNAGKAWYMQMMATAAGNHMTTTFTFSKAVVGLTFSIYDIDRVLNAGNTVWTDRVIITGVKSGGGAAALTATKPAGSTVDIVTGTTATSGHYTGTGNVNIAPTSSNGNGIATFTDAGGVTSVTIDYIAPDAAYIPSTPFQFMGVGNLGWTSCK